MTVLTNSALEQCSALGHARVLFGHRQSRRDGVPNGAQATGRDRRAEAARPPSGFSANHFGQEPGTPLGLVDPVLDEARRRGVAVLVAKRMSGTEVFHQAPIVRKQLGQHILVGHARALKPGDVTDPWHFARLFRSEVGMTPSVWVEAARVEAARRLLEDGRDTPKQVAARCGFADADVLRRAFARRVGVTPAEYRRRYGVVAA